MQFSKRWPEDEQSSWRNPFGDFTRLYVWLVLRVVVVDVVEL